MSSMTAEVSRHDCAEELPLGSKPASLRQSSCSASFTSACSHESQEDAVVEEATFEAIGFREEYCGHDWWREGNAGLPGIGSATCSGAGTPVPGRSRGESFHSSDDLIWSVQVTASDIKPQRRRMFTVAAWSAGVGSGGSKALLANDTRTSGRRLRGRVIVMALVAALLLLVLRWRNRSNPLNLPAKAVSRPQSDSDWRDLAAPLEQTAEGSTELFSRVSRRTLLGHCSWRRRAALFGAGTAGVVAVVLSAEPPAGQLASGIALGAVLMGRFGADKFGVLGAVIGACCGASLGCVAGFVVSSVLAPATAEFLRRLSKSRALGWVGYMFVGFLPSVALFAELLRLCPSARVQLFSE